MIELTIDQFNKKGWGIGTSSRGKVEVIGGIPGDVLSVSLGKKRRKKWRADLLQIVQPSGVRVQPRCLHAAFCGGCTWQQMDYAAQLQEKQKRVSELFASFGVPVDPIAKCKDPWGYRNKMEFSFSSNKAGEKFLGLMIAGSRGHVHNLTECHLATAWSIHLLNNVRIWWESSGLPAYRMNDTGALRTITVRESKRTGDKLVMLTVSGNPEYAIKREQLKSFVNAVIDIVPIEQRGRLSIFLRVQQIHKGMQTQFYEMHLHGPDHMLEKMDVHQHSFTFKISPTSFFQPNIEQAEKLYSLALDMVSFPKNHVLDLYAGTATLGIAMAKHAEKVTAIEINPHACFDANVNCELNGINNLEIICGDVGKKVEGLKEKFDLVVVDPPRTGLDAKALSHITALKPKEILYISCNPHTQADNIHQLVLAGYQLVKIQPVDQFPHTPHIETIAYLRHA